MDREYHGEYHILGTDTDPESLEIARENARKAGVGRLIEFREGDATKLPLPAESGVLVCNPPYGERMLEQRSAQRLYQELRTPPALCRQVEEVHHFLRAGVRALLRHRGDQEAEALQRTPAVQRLHVLLTGCF
jgi:23S rRNA G2445 N2-methylase RlmL